MAHPHFRSQSSVLGLGTLEYDHIFHLENLRSEAGDFFASMGIEFPTKRHNVTNTERLDYKKIYDPDGELQKMIRQRYQEDYERFGYA